MGQQTIDDTLYGTAMLYYLSGEYAEADSYARQALAQQEQVLGPEHLDVARSLHLLALINGGKVRVAKEPLAVQQQRDQESEQFYRRVLAIREKALGLEHPDTIECMSNLGIFYSNRGRYTEAESLLQQALHLREKVSGESRGLVLSLDFLGNCYVSQGKNDEAKELLLRGIPISERVLGPEHPYTAGLYHQLARVYQAQHNSVEAEQAYQKAISICEQALGKDHPDIAVILQRYASLLHSMQKEQEAVVQEARANAILEKAEV